MNAGFSSEKRCAASMAGSQICRGFKVHGLITFKWKSSRSRCCCLERREGTKFTYLSLPLSAFHRRREECCKLFLPKFSLPPDQFTPEFSQIGERICAVTRHDNEKRQETRHFSVLLFMRLSWLRLKSRNVA